MIKKRIITFLCASVVCATACAFAACAHECDYGEWETVKVSTCIEKGYKVRVCKDPDCGKRERAELEIDPDAHRLNTVTAEAADCENDGHVAYSHCSLCLKNFDGDGNEIAAGDEIIPAAHDFTEYSAVAATDHTDGRVAYKHCETCKKDYDAATGEILADAVIPAKHADYDRDTLYCRTCEKYVITTVGQFKAFRDGVNAGNGYDGKTVVLDADLDLKNEEWTPINSFKGTFDGQGHTIKNLKISGGDNLGLFGRQWQIRAVISNFTIDGANISGGSSVGVVLGNTASTAVTDVTVKNARISANHYAGGIVGYAYTEISGCTVEGLEIVCVPDMGADGYDNGDKVGGIVGYLCSGKAESCTVSKISLKGYRDVGGIAGTATTGDGPVSVTGNVVSDATVCVDQTVNHYGDKDANAGEIVGRVIGSVVMENNSHGRVTIDIKLNS